MTNPFEWYHSLYYGEKWKLNDFDTKNSKSLDALLKQLFKTVLKHRKLKMKNSLPAFNAAYYIAVCVANTEGLDETNLDEDIATAVQTIWEEDYKRNHGADDNPACPFAERMLVKWMAYAILFLQEKKTDEMDEFLGRFRDSLVDEMNGVIRESDEMADREGDFRTHSYHFLNDLPQMIEAWEYRYRTDLRPRALHPQYFTNNIWFGHVRRYGLNTFKWQLTFYRTQAEQMAFLDWAKKMSDKYKHATSDDELPF